MYPRTFLGLVLLSSASGCVEIPNVIPGGGMEGHPCIEGKCLGDLQCADGLCVDVSGADTDEGTSSAGNSTSSDPASESDTDAEKPTTTSSTTTAGSGPSTTTGTGTGSTDPTGAPPGESCSTASDCPGDQQCYILGVLGGTCGECLTDADCPGGGCTPPSPIEGLGAYCNDGSLGDGCQSDAACNGGLDCVVVLDVPGVLTATACSECATDSDCPGYCAPDLHVPALTGYARCVGSGELDLGETCSLDGSPAACASGTCGEVNVMGLLLLGICGECDSDADCPGLCQPGSVSLETGATIPAQCV